MHQRSIVAALAAVCALLCAPAAARASCTINTITGLAFGVYNPFNATPLDSNVTGTFSCSTNAVVTISTGSSGTYATRTMRNGVNALNYNVYFDAAHTIIAGDGQPGSASYPVNAGNNQPFAAFGRVFALQDVPAGNYADTIVVTFTF